MFRRLAVWMLLISCAKTGYGQADVKRFQHFLWTKAHRVPSELTSEESGYFSIVEGQNGKLYIGTAKYGDNAFLVEFDPADSGMRVVVDAEAEIGIDRKGFAAQAKFHTRNHVGRSGRIYVGTKQGYPMQGEPRDAYPGGHPMVYDPSSKETRVYDVPVKHHGIISVTPDESRGLAYISTCDDARPIESTHFMILDLAKGTYRRLLDCRHMYAFIVVDYRGRAYHPVLGGRIARYDPETDRLEQLPQLIDGRSPSKESHLADPQSHPINWDISPDRRTLYAVPMSGNQLYAYDLSHEGNYVSGRSCGPLIAGALKTDCRAMCVGPDGTVWAGVAATFQDRGQFLHLISYRPGDSAPRDHGTLAISNPDYASLTDSQGKTKKWHHGVVSLDEQTAVPRYTVMGICASSDGTVYLTTLYPFTLHAIKLPRVAGITTEYRHNSHADMFLTRLFKTDTLDGKGQQSPLQLISVHTDQNPPNDTSRHWAASVPFRIADSIGDALLNQDGKMGVDGVMLIAEHGDYPESDTGQFRFPKRQMFESVVKQFERTGQVVPVFFDKHLADTWSDAHWIYEKSRELQIPVLAGSSLPLTWREPPVDVQRGSNLEQIFVTSFHRLDSYGIHALEIVQSLAERRRGSETGIRSVQCLEGDAVWEARDDGIFDPSLLDAALSRLKTKRIPENQGLEDLVKTPHLMIIEYRDGLRAFVLSLEYAVLEWAAAWKHRSGEVESTLFVTQEERPFMHFSWQLMAVERLVQTGRPLWPLERTLLTTGILDGVLVSRRDGGKRMETPWLNINYSSQWNWSQPPPAPQGRPIEQQ